MCQINENMLKVTKTNLKITHDLFVKNNDKSKQQTCRSYNKYDDVLNLVYTQLLHDSNTHSYRCMTYAVSKIKLANFN